MRGATDTTTEKGLASEPKILPSILDAIGDTPLVRLPHVGAGVKPQLVAKVEALNPGGSIKDRVAVALIEAAERDGRLKPGGTIVEPTSGNTGTGLAIAARLKGYRVIAVMPDKMSKEKIDLLRAYGAEVVVAPTDVAPDSPQSYYRVADRLTEEIPGAFQPNQYRNQANPEAHYRSTGPELWEQTAGRITHLVVGVGTGGTVTGTGRYLKERNPGIQIIGADPVGSIYSNDDVHPYLVEGVGEDFWPDTFDRSIVDRWVTVSDRDSFLMTRRLAREEGILTGGSGGLAVQAALEAAATIDDPDALMVVVLPDGGRSYLSKIYSDAWMTQYGFLERPSGEMSVGEVLRRKHESGEVPPLVTIRAHDKVRDAVALLHEHRVSQLPVVSSHDAHAVVGSVGERGLLKHAVEDSSLLNAEVIDVMEPPFPAVAADDAATEAVSLLAGERGAVLVTIDGRASGVLTRADLLEALAR
jgi:cystathionine beta-synthase